MNYRDYEQTIMSAQRPAKQVPITCKSCNCEWFEQIRLTKFDSNAGVAPGQVLPESFHVFAMLRCAKCGDLQEIPAATSGWDKPSQDRYFNLIEELEKKKEPAPDGTKA